MKLTKYERETIILFNEKEEQASVYTCNPELQSQLDELCKNQPARVEFVRSNSWGGRTYLIPKKWVKIKPARVLSEAQKRVLEDMNRARREKNT